MKILVEKDCFDFLFYAFFRSETDPYVACSKSAYLDFCRTLRLKNKTHSYWEKIASLFEQEINKLLSRESNLGLSWSTTGPFGGSGNA